MPSKRKHPTEPHWFIDYNQSNQQRDKSVSRKYDLLDSDEDTWSRDDLLYKDNLHEVLSKWKNLDCGIWGKIICLERNRRVAKAYARFGKLNINGSDVCFDGYTIGLEGFDNPYRAECTENVLKTIGNEGLDIQIDSKGNIWIERHCDCSVYTPECHQQSLSRNNHLTAIGRELETRRGHLSKGKPFKLFDMARFRENVTKEMSSTYPDMASLQLQCISVISFGSNCLNILESPLSILVINIYALDILRSRLCPVNKPIKESFKTVAGSVWQSVRRLASRSSQRNSLSNMFDRSGGSKLIDENPYSSITSTVSYHDINSLVGYGAIRTKEPSPRLTYSQFNQFRISPMESHIKSSTIDFHRPKNEPPPDYDTTSCSSISTIYKDTRQSSNESKDEFDDWSSTPVPNKPSFYPQTRLSGPLNSVFRAFPLDAPVVDPNSNQKDETENTGDSSESSVSNASETSPESESTDEAANHIYSSIVDGKSSSNQSSKSESSDQYGEITTIDEDKDEDDGADRVSVASEA
ncbi:uncharacterized protein LOC107363398 [Tetranychus urticae]|uniref:MH2 domain-containing protein n=1 Tax=Tetranychus urticae TaxID=32264 RepID=T1KFP8_TETUR|nr:uncharacterized protein LOC107363398 [Tetranychus urticae]